MKSIIFFLAISNIVVGQNLIQNADFEEYEICPTSYKLSYSKDLIPFWIVPAKGCTPDYFNRCSKGSAGVPNNFAGDSEPHSGDAYVGIIGGKYILDNEPKFEDNYAEYIQCKFTSDLVKDSVYQVSFFYKLSSHSIHSFNGLGVYVSNKRIKVRGSYIEVTPNFIMNEQLRNRDKWIEFRFQYQAKGGEAYLTIGRFSKDEKTAFERLDDSGIRKSKVLKESYVYIDDVFVGIKNDDSEYYSDETYLATDTVQLNSYISLATLEDRVIYYSITNKLKSQQSLRIYLYGDQDKSSQIKLKLLETGILHEQVYVIDGVESKFKLSFE